MATQSAVGLPVLAGRWEYDTRIVFAAGNNAQTFAGKDLRSGKEVVVKIFSHAADGRGRERFQREARLHEELEHDAILELLDRGSDDGVDYMVTRRVRPGSLWDVVRERSQLSPAATLAIGTRIADALAYMHGRSEVHGDISPGNILLDEAEVSYLADFGLSKRIATTPIATTGDSFGTPGFSLSREPDTQRTYEDDVYGLAAVLWFCLSGKPPSTSARARRREMPNRALRAPLNRALQWESENIPTADSFKDGLIKHWAKVGQDWRVVSAPPRRSRTPLALAGALMILLVTGVAAQVLQPKPADAAQSTIDRNGVTLRLPGKWSSRQPPALPAFGLRSPVAAGRGRTTIVAGRAPSAGSGLVARDAVATLPKAARKPRSVLVGAHAALVYGPANRFGGAVEILAMPLASDALVVRCGGPVKGLSRVCAQASADLELREGEVQPFAPSPSTARKLRAATKRLDAERRQQRALLAATANPDEIAKPAKGLADVNHSFAESIASLPSTAQNGKAMDTAAAVARELEAAYTDLAKAKDESAWSAALSSVDRSEQRLDTAIRRLGALPVYGRS
jgi:Protein kinase domain